jgi:hypothetical protein
MKANVEYEVLEADDAKQANQKIASLVETGFHLFSLCPDSLERKLFIVMERRNKSKGRN